MYVVRPRYLYHLSFRRNLASIQEHGLVPRLASEWKELLPRDIVNVPVTWFTGNVRRKGDFIHSTRQVIAVKAGFFVPTRLYKLYQLVMENMGLRHADWWVYTDVIPSEALVFGSIAEIRALEPAV